MNSYCTFYIVRHAQSEANAKGLRAGQTDYDISQEGIEQAKKRSEELKDVHFDAAFSSDLLRAKKTAEIIVLERKLEINLTRQLRERAWGKQLEGKTVADSSELLKEWESFSYKERFSQKPFEDMESDEELMVRFITFLRETAVAYQGKTILLVAHSNMMRTLLVHLGWATLSELDRHSMKNTAYFVLKSDGVEFEVVKTVGIEKKQG